MQLRNNVTTFVLSAALAMGMTVGTSAQITITGKKPAEKPAAAKPEAKPAVPQAAGSFKPDQKVEVREGDTWSAATLVKQEGRKFQVRYDDGTEEWVPADRLRQPGAPGAEPAKAEAPAAAGAAAPKTPKEVFAVGAKVEVKDVNRWKPATIKNKDGDLYLIIFTDRPEQFWWQWVHPGIIRKVGSAKDWPDWGRGVKVTTQGVAKAKEEAKQEFANLEAEMAAAARGEKKDPFAPLPYDKPITDIKLDKIDDIVPVGGPAKLATFDPEPAPAAKLAERGYVLQGKGGKWHTGPAALFIAGPRVIGAYVNDGMAADVRTTALEFIDLVNGQNLGQVEAEPMSMPTDVSPTGDRMAGIQHGFHSSTKIRVDVHSIKAGSKPQHIISFVPYPSDHWKDVDSARFLGDNDHLLTVSTGGSVIAWEVPTATALWRYNTKYGAKPAISPGGKQVAVLVEGSLMVLDSLTGKVLCRIPGNRSVRELSFTPDGKRVIGMGTWSVACWDLEVGRVLPDIGLPANGAGGSLLPLDGRFVLVGGTDVLDLDKKMVVWRYHGARAFRGAPPQTHAGRVWNVVTDNQRNMLISAKLPHDVAIKTADSVEVAQGLLVKPGSRVSLSVSIEGTPEQQQKITAAMTDQLKQQGITVDPNSPIKLIARTEQGKTTEQEYTTVGGAPWDRETQKVTVTEKITRVFIEHEGKVAWESRTSSGMPMFITRKEGQGIQEAVAAASQFNIGFLEGVRVPAYIPRPSDTPWLGESTWGTTGISNDKKIPPQPDVAVAPADAPAAKPEGADGF
jgi:WD40 repeat protein